MQGRKDVYADEFLAAHNNELEEHKQYQPDMEFTSVDVHGSLIMDTRDRQLKTGEEEVFNEVVEKVRATHKLIIP